MVKIDNHELSLCFGGSSQWRYGVVAGAEASIWALACWGYWFSFSFFCIEYQNYPKFPE